MLKTSLLAIFFVLTICAYGQNQKSFEKLIHITNSYLDAYGMISPFNDEIFAIEALPFSKKDFMEIKDLGNDEDWYSADSIDNYELSYFLQVKIMDCLSLICSHPQFKNNDINKWITDGDLLIVHSQDRKLYNFSLDEKSGGTYRSRVSMMYYAELDTVKQNSADIVNREVTNQYGIFNNDGYSAIYDLQTPEGVKYVLTNYARGCSYCFEHGVTVISFSNGNFHQEFNYSVSSRGWDETVSYNSETKTIDVLYYTDDLTRECGCNNWKNNDGTYDYVEDYNNQRKCECRFEFQETQFVLTKSCWEKTNGIIDD